MRCAALAFCPHHLLFFLVWFLASLRRRPASLSPSLVVVGAWPRLVNSVTVQYLDGAPLLPYLFTSSLSQRFLGVVLDSCWPFILYSCLVEFTLPLVGMVFYLNSFSSLPFENSKNYLIVHTIFFVS